MPRPVIINLTMLGVGVRLGRFELVSLLGRGGMGEVWRARDPRLGREVALKVLPDDMAQDADRVARFEREARALAALSHPNVAQIYEVGEAAPEGVASGESGAGRVLHFLVMELVEGETLAQCLGRGAMSGGEVVRIAGEVARALMAAHGRGVIHRDLKPANIVITPDGQAKVLDFGLARIDRIQGTPQDVEITAKLSSSGVVVGTAAYMAPEQLRGEECDGQCDVWGLGCCIGEMLARRRMFAAPTVPEIVSRILDGAPDLDAISASAPKSLRMLVADCLQRDRGRRPPMVDVARRLGGMVTPTGPWWRVVLGSWGWMGAAIGIVAIAVSAWFAAQSPRAPAAAQAVSARLRIAVDEPRVEAVPARFATLPAQLGGALVRAIAARKSLEVATSGLAPVHLQPLVVGRGDAVDVQLCAVDARSGVVVAFLERPLPAAGTDAALVEVAESFGVMLELEGVCRELEREDSLHGFLVRRTHSLDAARAFQEGVAFYTRTRWREADAAFKRATDADAKFWPGYVYLAQVAGASSFFDKGRELLKSARTLLTQPEATEATVLEVGEALLAEDTQRAVEVLEQARRLFPESGELTYRTAWAYRVQDRPDEAIPLLRSLIERGWQPDWSPTREQLGYDLFMAGRYDEALQLAEDGESRFPKRYHYAYVAALSLHRLGRETPAREALARAVRKRLDFTPTDPLIVYQASEYWASLLRWSDERARLWRLRLEAAEKRLRDVPSDQDVQLAKGESLVGLERFAEAKSVLEPLAAANAPDPNVLLAVARARHGVGDAAGARQALERAGQLWRQGSTPALGTLAYNIACGWAMVGEARVALDWLLRARDQYGFDRIDLTLDPELDPLREAGLLAQLQPKT